MGEDSAWHVVCGQSNGRAEGDVEGVSPWPGPSASTLTSLSYLDQRG